MGLSPFKVALVYALVGTVVVHLVLMAWREEQKFLNVALAAVGAAFASLVPTVGGPLSLAVMLGLLYWRCTASLPALVASVAIARLAMVPALASLR